MPAISPKDVAPPLLSGLREQVRRLERAHTAQRAGRSAVPLGISEIDALLPEGGLLTGALHEIEAGPTPSGRVAPHDGPALGFAAHMLGRFGEGTILWCRQPAIGGDALPYAPALSAWFDPARILMVTTPREENLFWAMEEGLRTPGIAAVLGETRATDPTAGRRLSLAAEKSGVPALLLRAQPAPPQSICTTRWRVTSAPSPEVPGIEMLKHDRFRFGRRPGSHSEAVPVPGRRLASVESDHAIGAARWQVELRRNRFGTPSVDEMPAWLLEWNDETHHLAVVPQARNGSSGTIRRERLVG